ncbi:MAG: hypothetical protein HKN40_04785 [Winogradskyella sp.]|uniref:hypothetical protein n=1 Tax=Winogradskyella sp. TaxID=1883156 RepID=UPI0018266615|nr:hypothetical protein [Winogradskyella sp.]
MKRSAHAQAALIVLFAFCFLSNNPISLGNSLFATVTNTMKTPDESVIIYNATEGLKSNKLPKHLKQLDVINKVGRKVLSINKFNNSIYLNTLKSGAYTIKAKSNSGKLVSLKLLKY